MPGRGGGGRWKKNFSGDKLGIFPSPLKYAFIKFLEVPFIFALKSFESSDLANFLTKIFNPMYKLVFTVFNIHLIFQF